MSYYSLITANRASSLLYSFLTSRENGTYLIPANVCPVIPMTFRLANVGFRFADIARDTLCIDKQECFDFAKRCRGNGGVVYVRTYGCLEDEESFFNDLKNEYPNFTIIDDRCLCLPEITMERTSADMILYSTGYAKQIDLGEGGFCYVKSDEKFPLNSNLQFDNEELDQYCVRSIETGRPLSDKPIYWLDVKPLKENVDSYLITIRNKIEERQRQRITINKIYDNALPEDLRFANKFQNWRYNIRVTPYLKGIILKELFENELFASSHYKPVNKLFDHDCYPVVNDLSENVINLFNDYHYTEQMALQTTEVIKNILSK